MQKVRFSAVTLKAVGFQILTSLSVFCVCYYELFERKKKNSLALKTEKNVKRVSETSNIR